MDIETRPLTASDQAVLWEFLYLAIHVPTGEAPPPREILNRPEIGRYVVDWGRPSDLGRLALVAGEAAGAAWLRLLTGAEQGYGYVDEQTPELSMAVKAEYRGQGVGQLLLAELLTAAGKRYAAVSLSVSLDNRAKRLYQRMGFEPVAVVGSSLTMIKRFGR